MNSQAQRLIFPQRAPHDPKTCVVCNRKNPFEQARELRELARTISELAAGLEHAADQLLEAAERVIDEAAS